VARFCGAVRESWEGLLGRCERARVRRLPMRFMRRDVVPEFDYSLSPSVQEPPVCLLRVRLCARQRALAGETAHPFPPTLTYSVRGVRGVAPSATSARHHGLWMDADVDVAALRGRTSLGSTFGVVARAGFFLLFFFSFAPFGRERMSVGRKRRRSSSALRTDTLHFHSMHLRPSPFLGVVFLFYFGWGRFFLRCCVGQRRS
jgi:hypothetical protein